jgi:hypothetical protein
MKKSRSKFLKIVDEKHDINFHWPDVDLSETNIVLPLPKKGKSKLEIIKLAILSQRSHNCT